MSQNNRKVDIQSFIDAQPLSLLQKKIMWLCFVMVAIDGFDTVAIGFIAPALKDEWGLKATELAPLFGSGLFGLMAGAMIFGPLADKLGRKPILISSVIIFGLATVFAAFSPNLPTLTVLRFITGLGLGGVMPNAIALTAEYAPTARRSQLVTMMFCGFTIGSALVGILSAQLLPYIGWHGMLLIGGIAALLLVPVLMYFLPESIRFLIVKKQAVEKTERIARKIAPVQTTIPTLIPFAHESEESSWRNLFSKGYALGTFLIWIACFMSLLIIYMISSWMPILLTNSSFNLSKASWLTTVFQIGGTISAVVLGLLMDKRDAIKILSAAYLLGALCLVGLGWVIQQANIILLTLSMFCVGGICGTQVGLNAFTSGFYPTHCRATGISWSNAVGRLGAAIGSVLGGWLMSLDLSSLEVMSLLAIPAILAAVALLLIQGLKQEQSIIPELS
ncbi:MFS transporter [Acinetobacter sp. MB5]|uniref:MFS transporter n=1 Tax=Acinetobacter sp. MB5 TaxID=2069438 RepID=UPI000DCFD147|nr:MFS transporter [Acinetobacter sp. MB5]